MNENVTSHRNQDESFLPRSTNANCYKAKPISYRPCGNSPPTGFEDKSSKPKPGKTLRHFDFQKGEVASYLARSSFPNLPRPETMAGIGCSADEVVAYSFTAHVYIQMKYASDAPEVYHTEKPFNLRFISFAATGPKEIYGYFSKADKGGLYYLAFDETSKTAQWLPVTGAAGVLTTPGVITALYGADGDKLVVSRAEDPVGASALHWVPVVDRSTKNTDST